ncbi:MAG: 50S ribosomal protein L31, partial [Actinomycetes bacterium]
MRPARPQGAPPIRLRIMQTDIHPKYGDCKVHCSCGNEFVTRSVVDSMRVELCAECHPFYTGKQKLVDTGGRVE